MSAIDEFEEAREDLEALLIEVLGSVFSEEAMPVWDDALPPGPIVSSRLAIHDEVDDSYTMVEVRTSAIVARVLASRMLLTADPGPDDLLDAVGELGNIAGGNVKSLLRHSCRLSLPLAEMTDDASAPDVDGVTVRAAVLGQVVELTVHLAGDIEGLTWPGSASEEVVETPA
ncbi:chemotaxis protein CheX [Kineosporia sp. R_H_3]|uniref:chemotaxis protein CheX n=1 Tax=Kineosporia sp. R_H_3 TaxID=1961848 RepID=UPI000B4B3F71|nr:chemotaxis protein CheX [Kineosporia sp. R_H_3]